MTLKYGLAWDFDNQRPWLNLYGVFLKPSFTDRRQIKDPKVKRPFDYFKELPEVIKILIFSKLEPAKLAKAACVCRDWRLLTMEPILWRNHCLHYLSPWIPGGEVELLNRLKSERARYSWRRLLLETPYARPDGIYISRNSYVRAGVTEFRNQSAFHMVLSFRYFRFFEDGIFVCRTSPLPPRQVLPSLVRRSAMSHAPEWPSPWPAEPTCLILNRLSCGTVSSSFSSASPSPFSGSGSVDAPVYEGCYIIRGSMLICAYLYSTRPPKPRDHKARVASNAVFAAVANTPVTPTPPVAIWTGPGTGFQTLEAAGFGSEIRGINNRVGDSGSSLWPASLTRATAEEEEEERRRQLLQQRRRQGRRRRLEQQRVERERERERHQRRLARQAHEQLEYGDEFVLLNWSENSSSEDENDEDPFSRCAGNEDGGLQEASGRENATGGERSDRRSHEQIRTRRFEGEERRQDSGHSYADVLADEDEGTDDEGDDEGDEEEELEDEAELSSPSPTLLPPPPPSALLRFTKPPESDMPWNLVMFQCRILNSSPANSLKSISNSSSSNAGSSKSDSNDDHGIYFKNTYDNQHTSNLTHQRTDINHHHHNNNSATTLFPEASPTLIHPNAPPSPSPPHPFSSSPSWNRIQSLPIGSSDRMQIESIEVSETFVHDVRWHVHQRMVRFTAEQQVKEERSRKKFITTFNNAVSITSSLPVSSQSTPSTAATTGLPPPNPPISPSTVFSSSLSQWAESLRNPTASILSAQNDEDDGCSRIGFKSTEFFAKNQRLRQGQLGAGNNTAVFVSYASVPTTPLNLPPSQMDFYLST